MNIETGAQLAQIVIAVATVTGLAASGVTYLLTRRSKIRRFEYPERGDSGENILNAGVTRVVLRDRYSMVAKVPDSKNLTVLFSGVPIDEKAQDDDLTASSGAWYYRIPPENWRGEDYDNGTPDIGPSQRFRSRGGWADLSITFERTGTLTISVHEGDSPTPTWTKTILVVPARSQVK